MDDQNSSILPPPLPSSSSSPFAGISSKLSPQISSPYLDFDPSIINPSVGDSQWIFPDGQINKRQRGRFELAFSQIGGSVMIGAGIGATMGGVNGMKTIGSLGDTASWTVKRSQLINYMTKNGANTANTFGTIAVVYSVIGVGLSYLNEEYDDINTFIAGGMTGLLYGAASDPTKVTTTAATSRLTPIQAKIKRSVIGTIAGLALSTAYTLFMNRDSLSKR